MSAMNRPGDQLREERNKRQVLERAARGRQLAAIDVHYVSQALERVERNPGGQHDRQGPGLEGNVQCAQEYGHRIQKEVEILKEPQQREVHDDAGGEDQPPPAWHLRFIQEPADEEIEATREDQQPEESDIPPSVEQPTGGHHQKIPKGQEIAAEEIEQQKGREELQEYRRVKEHTQTEPGGGPAPSGTF